MPPPELFNRYRTALTDPELTHHRDSIALVDAALSVLFDHFNEGVGPDLWKQVRKKFRSMRAADRAGDVPRARLALEELEQLIEDGTAQSVRSHEMLKLLEARRRHADSETKRKLSESVTFSYDFAMTFYAALGAAARKHFGDDQERSLPSSQKSQGSQGRLGSTALTASPETQAKETFLRAATPEKPRAPQAKTVAARPRKSRVRSCPEPESRSVLHPSKRTAGISSTATTNGCGEVTGPTGSSRTRRTL